MKPLLLHMGSGALGLGLVVPEFVLNTDAEVYILNRNGGDELSKRRNDTLKRKKYYYLRSVGFDTPVKFTDIIYYDQIDVIEELIAQKRPIFLTTAIKEYGIEASLDLISRLIYIRNNVPTRHPLVFIACENAINSSRIKVRVLDKLRSDFGADFVINNNIMFLDCVVDRICNSPAVENDNVIVSTEEYGSWIIDKTMMQNTIQYDFINDVFDSCNNISVVDSLEFFTNRKKWIVNAMHQLISLYAHLYKFQTVNRFVDTQIGSYILAKVSQEVMKVYFFNQPDADFHETKKYFEEIQERLSYPSLVSSALTRFKKGKIESFFSDFYRKVGEPAINYMEDFNEDEKRLFFIPFIMFQVTGLISGNRLLD